MKQAMATRTALRVLTLCALALVSTVLDQQLAAAESTPAERLRELLEPLIERQIAEQHIPGLAVGIVLDGKTIYARGFGVQKLGHPTPVTEHSLFHQASITKPYVATAIVQLAEQGALDLDDRVTEHLEYFKVQGEDGEALTIRQLLNHTSGMPDVINYDWANPKYGDDELERHVRQMERRNLRWPPGEKFAYSNLGFEVLGDIVAKTSGQSFETFIDQHILEPLAMNDSTLMVRDADSKLVAAPHVLNRDGEVIVSEVYPYNRRHAPSSTLVSNVLDMSRWAMANLNRGSLDDDRILSEASYEELWQESATVVGSRSIGLGWFLDEIGGRSIVTHSGSDVGFVAMLVLVPEEKLGVTVMANRHRANLRAIVEKAIEVALD